MRDHIPASARRPTALLLLAALLPGPALAQYIGRAPPPPAAPPSWVKESPPAALARNLRLIAASPRNFIALVAAGRAALELEDYQSAAGFFGRAEEVAPSDPAPKIGMGAASVALGDPRGGLIWFAQAQRLGASPAALGADRGLAHDLLGQQVQAQADYRAALAGADAVEARRRLALSLAISRDTQGAIAMLQPLLNQRDPGAQRARAFILALGGDRAGARVAIERAMPGSSARIDPFFMVLPSLSPEQKAAAVHLGTFPTPSQIRLAPTEPVRVASNTVVPRAVAPAPPQARAIATPPAATVRAWKPPRRPAGRAVEEEEREERVGTRIPGPRIAAPSRRVAAPALVPEPVSARPQPLASAAAAVVMPSSPSAAPAPRVAEPGFAQPGVAQPGAAEPLVPVASSAPPPAIDMAAASLPASTTAELLDNDRLSGIDKLLAASGEVPPPAPQLRVETETPASDEAAANKAAAAKKVADDKRAATAKKAGEAKKMAEAKKAADARKAAALKKEQEALGVAGSNWVQLAGGSNRDRMASEYKKLAAKSSALRKRGGHVTQGKDYFRLLVGPFDDKSDAQGFVNQLAKDDVDGFSWTRTPATIKIEKLSPK